MIPEQKEISRVVNHIIDVHTKSECSIRPHFFLTGPSGSGKSYIIQQAAEKADVAFFEINAAQLTKEGIAGNSLSKALAPLRQSWDRPTVIFVDEFDKLLNQNGGSMEHTLGVQDEFLKCLESDYVDIFGDYGKYHRTEAKRVLFVFAGAFGNKDNVTLDDLRDFGLRTEFVGRVGLVFNTHKISLESMLALVPKTKLIDDYLKVFPQQKKDKVVAAVRARLKEEYRSSNVGLRLLNTLVHQHFMQNL